MLPSPSVKRIASSAGTTRGRNRRVIWKAGTTWDRPGQRAPPVAEPFSPRYTDDDLMTVRVHRLSVGILLALLFSVHAVAARPLEALGELGAVACCEDLCDRGETASQASRCCGVDPIADELTSALLVVLHPPSSWRIQPAAGPATAGRAPDRSIDPPRGPPSPLYLVTRSLLI